MRKKVSIEEERVEGTGREIKKREKRRERRCERKETKYYQMIT